MNPAPNGAFHANVAELVDAREVSPTKTKGTGSPETLGRGTITPCRFEPCRSHLSRVHTMIIERYRVQGRASARYVRRVWWRFDISAACGGAPAPPLYAWCEQSAENPGRDVAQGHCQAEDLPPDVRQACDNYHGAFYACEWPFDGPTH